MESNHIVDETLKKIDIAILGRQQISKVSAYRVSVKAITKPNPTKPTEITCTVET